MMMARTGQNSDALSLMLIASRQRGDLRVQHESQGTQMPDRAVRSAARTRSSGPPGRPPAARCCAVRRLRRDIASRTALTSGLSNLARSRCTMWICETVQVIPRHAAAKPVAGAASAVLPGALAARGRCRPQRRMVGSVTVTWSPAPAPGRSPAPLRRALAAAADAIAPAIAELAAATTVRLIERQRRSRPALPSPRRRLPPMARALPRPDRTS